MNFPMEDGGLEQAKEDLADFLPNGGRKRMEEEMGWLE